MNSEVVDDYAWIMEGDDRILHKKRIGSGGFGDVHEVPFNSRHVPNVLLDDCQGHRSGILHFSDSGMLMVYKPFARKIVRCIGAITNADIENEARVISLLQEDAHSNIVTVLDHGWCKSSLRYYFIDMELCDFTLHDYIVYQRGDVIDLQIQEMEFLAPIFIPKNCTLLLRLQNLWAIGIHIALGLEHMHSKSLVHRDLKPGNGTQALKC
jgi:serine/threonine protein kinase